MSGAWRNFKVCARKSLDCHEGTVGRNMDIKGNSGESSERKEERCRESLSQKTYNHEKIVGRNMDIKCHSDEISDGNEE